MDINALRSMKIGVAGAAAGDKSLRELAAKYCGSTHGLFVGVHGNKKGADADPADLAKLLASMVSGTDDLASRLSAVNLGGDDDLRTMKIGAQGAPKGTDTLRALAKLHLGESHGLFIGIHGSKKGADADVADLVKLERAIPRLSGRATHVPAVAPSPAGAPRVIPPASKSAFDALAGSSSSTARVALCIGLGSYRLRGDKLPNAVRDAHDMARALGDVGFLVTAEVDLTSAY